MSSGLKIQRAWVYGGVTQNDDEAFIEDDLDVSESRPVLDAGGTDQEVVKTIDVSQLKAVFIKTSEDITIQTNDPDAPDDTISIAAGRALLWTYGCGMACPFSVDVTTLYITNDAATAPVVFIGVAFDPTPTPASSGE
jgi:hypothetical protein